MYVPATFAVSDERTLESFIERYDFATLISSSSTGLVASHIPIMLRRSAGKVVLIGHVARANNQWRQFDGNVEALAIFHGPHSYVSPTWYATSPAVPTWNYVVVHAVGKARVHHDGHDLAGLLRELTGQYEGHQAGAWSPDRLPEDFAQPMRGAIVGFEIAIDRLEGKVKLSQNRSAEDRRGVVAALEAQMSEGSRAVAALMRQNELSATSESPKP